MLNSFQNCHCVPIAWRYAVNQRLTNIISHWVDIRQSKNIRNLVPIAIISSFGQNITHTLKLWQSKDILPCIVRLCLLLPMQIRPVNTWYSLRRRTWWRWEKIWCYSVILRTTRLPSGGRLRHTTEPGWRFRRAKSNMWSVNYALSFWPTRCSQHTQNDLNLSTQISMPGWRPSWLLHERTQNVSLSWFRFSENASWSFYIGLLGYLSPVTSFQDSKQERSENKVDWLSLTWSACIIASGRIIIINYCGWCKQVIRVRFALIKKLIPNVRSPFNF